MVDYQLCDFILDVAADHAADISAAVLPAERLLSHSLVRVVGDAKRDFLLRERSLQLVQHKLRDLRVVLNC